MLSYIESISLSALKLPNSFFCPVCSSVLARVEEIKARLFLHRKPRRQPSCLRPGSVPILIPHFQCIECSHSGKWFFIHSHHLFVNTTTCPNHILILRCWYFQMALKGPPGPMGFTGRPGPHVCFLLKSLFQIFVTSLQTNATTIRFSFPSLASFYLLIIDECGSRKIFW